MRPMLALTAIALAVPLLAEPIPLTLLRTPGAQPAQFIGFPLNATDGLTVDAAGVERAVPVKPDDQQTFEDTGGRQSVLTAPGHSLRWRLQEAPPGERFHLYFLCRTGHQQGYEYVLPDMTYVVDVNGEAVEMEPVVEVAAVRTYQSVASWGHDMSWIRSRELVPLEAGDAITITCTENHAFVTRCLLVSPEAHELAGLMGRCTRAQERLTHADELIARVAEVFPVEAVEAACVAAEDDLRDARAAFEDLQAGVAEAISRTEAGEPVDVQALLRRGDRTAQDLEDAERAVHRRLAPPLQALEPGFRGRLGFLAEAPEEEGFHRRQSYHFAGVASRYLDAAQESLSAPPSVEALRRLASYLWRGEQFATRAEEERARIGPERPLFIPPATPAEFCPRGEVLLNGVWEMTWQGTPDAPADSDWFPIRVPHGPWHETVGRFMALDREWPAGQPWAWYRTRFMAPEDWSAGRLRLRFDAVFHLAEVYVNGQYCSRHIGGFDAFEVDVTGAARRGEENELLVFVHDTSVTALDRSEREGEPRGCSSGPNHYVISDLWGARFGGIWQDVALLNVPAVRVRDVLVQTSWRERTITVKTRLVNDTAEEVRVVLAQEALDGGVPARRVGEREVVLPGRGEEMVALTVAWPDPKPWGIGGEWGDPKNLYYLRSTLHFADGAPADVHHQRFGFREFVIADGQFHLNGVRLPLQGGGNWYLQEGKAPHGNRWFGLHMYRAERGMNVNIQRWHRHGDIAREFFDLGDELGMLSEPEGSYWGVYGIPDIQGFTDWDDPIWAENVAEHYRRWAWKHGNHPSIVLWSIENETFCATDRPRAMLDRFLAFGEALTEVDPTRPVTFHGIENGLHCTRRDDIEIVNLHYPPRNRVAGWEERWGGRPCIDGEFQNYPALFAMSGPDAEQAAAAVERMCDYIRGWTSYYREIELSGALFFLPYITGLITTADRSLMGPWGDLLPDPAEHEAIEQGQWMAGSVSISTTLPITWPSLSGPGIKCEQLVTGTGNRSIINWFDPDRPALTPNDAYHALAEHWDPMPPLEGHRAPEVIVTVTRGGEPARGVPVLARPLTEGLPAPRGAVTDPEGTAWLILQQAGSYEIIVPGGRAVFEASWLDTYAPPGYDDIPRLALTVD